MPARFKKKVSGILWLIGATIATYLVSLPFYFSHRIESMGEHYRHYVIDGGVPTTLVFLFGLSIYSTRRLQKLKRSLQTQPSPQKEAQAPQDILPICSFCKSTRNDEGEWQPVETYILAQTKRR